MSTVRLPRVSGLCALLAATPLFALPLAPPDATDLVDAGLSAASLRSDARLELRLPGQAPQALEAVQRPLAAGQTGVIARSPSGDTRVYAYLSGDRILSAVAHGRQGPHQLAERNGRHYWMPMTQTTGRGDALMPAIVRPTHPLAAPPMEAPDVDGRYTVRVLVLYTPLLAERLAPTTPAEEAQRLIFLSNAYHETSAVPVRYAYAGVAAFTGTDENAGFYENLAAMVGNRQVRELRDRTGADLVVLLRTQDGNADLCGLSSGFNGGQRGDPPTAVDPERDAFNVVGIAPTADGSSNCFDDVFPHELGHSLAAGHDYAGSAGYAYWKPYAHALPCLHPDGLRYFSLMWSLGVGPGGGRSELITNPDRVLDGQVCGADGIPGVEASQADNARTMAEAAPYVAAYRGKSGDGSGGGDASSGGGGAFPVAAGLILLLAVWVRRRQRQGVV